MANLSLLAKLGVDTKAFQKGLAKAQKRAGAFGKRLKKSFGGVKGALLGIAGIGAFGTSIRGSLELADSLKKTADRLGLTTDQLQDFTNAAKLSGIETTTASLGLQRYVRRLAEAQAGTGELKGILEEYNIEVRNTDGTNKDAMVVLGELADIMKGNTSQADNLRIAFKAFDSEGADLVRILDSGADGFKELAKEGNQAFGVFSESNVQALSNAKTSLESLGRSATIVSGKLIDLFGIDELMKKFAQMFTGIPVTDATDMFSKIFNPAKPEAFFQEVDKRLKEGLFAIKDFDAKELFDTKDLAKISEEILKISGSIRDVNMIGGQGASEFTRQELKGIKEMQKELAELQNKQGKGAIIAKLQEAIQARISEHTREQNKIHAENTLEQELALKLERDIESIKKSITDQELKLLRARAKGNSELIEQEELTLDVMEQTLSLMEDHNVQRAEAVDLAKQIVAEGQQAKDDADDDKKFEEQRNKIKQEELKLIRDGIKATDKEIEKQKKKIEFMERVLELQKEFGLSEEEATKIAKGEAKKSKKEALKGTGAGEIPVDKLDDVANKIVKGEGAKAGDYFHSRSTGGGETVFDKYLGGSKQGTYTENEMRRFIGEKALGQDTDDSQVDILSEIKATLEGKFVNE